MLYMAREYIENKRLGHYIFRRFYRILMMIPSSTDIESVHQDLELIEKSVQPPALAGVNSGLGGKRCHAGHTKI